MRIARVALVLMLCCGCAPAPAVIPDVGTAPTPAVVFDIDGTLTPRPLEFLEARPDAARAVQLFADKGYKIIYLSARNRHFDSATRHWLKDHQFPDGLVLVEETRADARHHDRFKTRMLQQLRAQGWQPEYAYGDSATDFTAYAAAAIPKQHVFALRREHQRSCQAGAWEACLGGWTGHLGYIENTVPPAAAK